MLLQKIDLWAKLAPMRLAHRHREQYLTFAELKTYSDALAVWIFKNVGHDPQKQTPIVVYGHKESEMLVLFLACLKAGHPYIPVDISIPAERLLKILETSGAVALLSPRSIPDKVKESGVFCQVQIRLCDVYSFAPRHAEPAPEWQIGLDDVWYIIFTSGSTGEPKGVQITRRALESFVNWVNQEYSSRREQGVFLNQAPFSFDLSVMDLYMALSNGGTLWSVDQEQIANAKDLFQSLLESRLTHWVSTPSFAELCLMDPCFTEKLLPMLHYFLFCGEVLPNDVASRLLVRFPRAQVINLYGPTECTVAVSGVNITTQIAGSPKPLPVGQNSTNCGVYICDPEDLDEIGAETKPLLSALPFGEKGEIVIAGPNVSIGYLNRPELTQRAFFSWNEGGICQQAYRTGDIGFWQNGQLFYLGRRDFQVKLHGYRIELGEIEEQLRKLSEIENAVVLPVVRRGKNAALQAFIKLNDNLEDCTQEYIRTSADMEHRLRQKLGQVLSAYMLPQRYIFIQNMPLTANGKVDRKALLGGQYDPV